MMSALVATCGYLAVFIGTLLEGEVSCRIRRPPWPTCRTLGGVVAIIGSTRGDMLAFLLRCWRSNALIERFPALAQRKPRIHELWERYDALFIIIAGR